MTIVTRWRTLLSIGLSAATVVPARAQSHLTTPKEQFGFEIGDDYRLATYTQAEAYWKKLATESDRMKLVSIGKTAEGRDQWMAIVSSPANLARLDQYRTIAERLARARNLTDAEARTLAKEGKAVVWIDGGLHASEVLGSHQLVEHLYRMVSSNDEETVRLLNDVIQLLVFANPDGMELVSSWYMRKRDDTKRSLQDLPRLYHKYIGHDNNRDFYMNAMPESENMSRVMYREWYPEIMYNHHQTGPSGAVMFAPPFRDPHNYYLDPLLINSLNMVGDAMHTRFAAENKPGVVEREASGYQTWWNGGLRTTAYFHNIIGILTETIGNPTPGEIPLVPERLVADGNGTFPITPQTWHFRQSIDYSLTANRAILDYASRYREQILYNIYQMGRTAIEKGNRDTWTILPSRVDRLRAQIGIEQHSTAPGHLDERTVTQRFSGMLSQPEERDPRGYVLPSDQPDFLTATAFVNALIKSGIEVLWATQSFAAGGKQYPAGSYVIKTAQAFRAHVLDMMEPQDYPNDIPYPGGPPKPPYDNAGYTLARQMGVRYDRILEGFDGPFQPVGDVLAKPPIAAAMPNGRGYVLSRKVNQSFLAVNRLLAAHQRVEVVTAGRPDRAGSAAVGDFYVPGSTDAANILKRLVDERGLPVTAVSDRPGETTPLAPIRIGLWDQYGGSTPSGWVRWLLEQYEFPYERVFAQRLDAGDLKDNFDALIFVSGAIPELGAPPPRPRPAIEDLPSEYRSWVGRVSPGKTIPQLKAFLEAGGRIVTIGSSTNLAKHLGLPIDNYLLERAPDGATRLLPPEKFFVPGSLLEVSVDPTVPAAWGMEDSAVVVFDNSPVFRLLPDATQRGVTPIAWFASPRPLRSGWAWGQTYLEGGIAAAAAKVGKGTLYLYGPEITFRSQPHGTYRFLFNGLYGM